MHRAGRESIECKTAMAPSFGRRIDRAAHRRTAGIRVLPGTTAKSFCTLRKRLMARALQCQEQTFAPTLLAAMRSFAAHVGLRSSIEVHHDHANRFARCPCWRLFAPRGWFCSPISIRWKCRPYADGSGCRPSRLSALLGRPQISTIGRHAARTVVVRSAASLSRR